MCADTKEIYPDTVKIDTEKISSSINAFGTYIFTGAANDADVLESAILKVKRQLFSQQHSNLARYPFPTALSPTVDAGIRSAMKEVSEESILPWPVDQQPWVNLLVGAMIRCVPEIYKVTPRAVTAVAFHECVGVGINQAKALIDRLHNLFLSREETELFAIYVMRLVKKYAPDVDGFTHLVSADHLGRVKWWPSSKVLAVEQKFAEFDKHGREILSAVCARSDKKEDERIIDNATETLHKYRKELWEIAGPVEEQFQKPPNKQQC